MVAMQQEAGPLHPFPLHGFTLFRSTGGNCIFTLFSPETYNSLSCRTLPSGGENFKLKR